MKTTKHVLDFAELNDWAELIEAYGLEVGIRQGKNKMRCFISCKTHGTREIHVLPWNNKTNRPIGGDHAS